MRQQAWFGVGTLVSLMTGLLSGCGGGSSSSGPTTPTTSATIPLVTYADPWPSAAPRERDIANNEFSSTFRSTFRYAPASVQLTYERHPSVPYFTGHIIARGLKPNFAYQLKLAGKPVYGSRGSGTADSYVDVNSRTADAAPVTHNVQDSGGSIRPINGDDWTNQQLGYAGRWWDDNDPLSTNLDDAYYQANYPSHTIYGYLFMGDFVTDEQGNADTPINASSSYHITWQDAQIGPKDTNAGTYNVQSTVAPYYGYGSALPSQSVKLWYQYEATRPHAVQLPAGTYHCRLLVTEEAFHTAGGTNGGVWQTVLATEAFGDRKASNDIVFTIQK